VLQKIFLSFASAVRPVVSAPPIEVAAPVVAPVVAKPVAPPPAPVVVTAPPPSVKMPAAVVKPSDEPKPATVKAVEKKIAPAAVEKKPESPKKDTSKCSDPLDCQY